MSQPSFLWSLSPLAVFHVGPICQPDLQTDRVGEPLVYALRRPKVHGQLAPRRPNTATETCSAKVTIVLTPCNELSNPAQLESGYSRDETSCKKIQKSKHAPPAPKSTVSGRNTLLPHRDVEEGLRILCVNIERMYRQAGCQVPLKKLTIWGTELAEEMEKDILLATLCGYVASQNTTSPAYSKN